MTALTSSLCRSFAFFLFPERSVSRQSVLSWSLHILWWGGCLAIGWQLQHVFGLERWLRSPWPMLHRVWLPLLIVLLYTASWLGAGLWKALRRDPSVRVCRAADAVWQEALRLLKATYPQAQDMPCFMMLGSLTTEVTSLLEAADISCVVSRPTAPLHVFAHPEALFVIASEKTATPFFSTHAPEAFSMAPLLQRDRPGRPLQGIVLLVPFEVLRSEVLLQEVIARCQADVQAIRHTTGRDFPLYFAITGMDTMANDAQTWFQRFPLVPAGAPEEMAMQIAEGIERLCQEIIPLQVRRQLRLDAAPLASGAVPASLRENMRRYQELAVVAAWQPSLCQLLTEGTWNEYEEPGRVAGCYFLPRLAAPMRGASAGAALLQDLFAHQHAVAWTPEATAQHEQQRLITRKGYGLVLAGWLSMGLIGAWLLAFQG